MQSAAEQGSLVPGRLFLERREAPRFVIEWSASYKKITRFEMNHGSPEVGQVIQAWCRDISKSGVCLLSPAPLAKGELLLIQFEIEEPLRRVEMFAKVAWAHAEGGSWKTGIHFMSGDDSDAEHLMVFFTEMFGQGFEPV